MMRGKSNLMRRGGSGGTDGILLGNAFSLCAMISDSISGTRKEHREIMALQIVSQFFYGASSIVLKGYSSTAQNVVAVFRNLAAMKDVKSKVLERARSWRSS